MIVHITYVAAAPPLASAHSVAAVARMIDHPVVIVIYMRGCLDGMGWNVPIRSCGVCT